MTDPAAENQFPAGSEITISSWVKINDYNSSDTIIAAMDTGINIRTRASLRLNAFGRLYYFANTVSGCCEPN